jgi:hypothetical protein
MHAWKYMHVFVDEIVKINNVRKNIINKNKYFSCMSPAQKQFLTLIYRTLLPEVGDIPLSETSRFREKTRR